MLNPSIGKLINDADNRYRLVNEIAKRARKIAKTAEENGETMIEKPVSLAINELSEEKNL